MKFQKAASLLIGFLVGVSLPAAGQGFVNFDFESAVVRPEYGIFQPWSSAAPGWSHSAGSDTDVIYYRARHLGSSQMFLLLDSTGPWTSLGPLAGNYSLLVESGSVQSGVVSPFVNAYISQTGLIPTEAQSLRLLVVGPLQVFVGGIEVPLVSLGGNAYGGDISSFAGTTAELKFLNAAELNRKDQYMVIDNIEFSSEPIPEPASLALLGLGGALWILRRRKT